MSDHKKLKRYLSDFIKKPGQINLVDIKEYQSAGGSLDTLYTKTSVLCEACRKGIFSSVEILLKAGVTVDVSDKHGCTPLYIAASHGHKDILHLLISAGALLDVTNNNGFTPLISALQNGHKECATSLIEAGANVNVNRPNTLGTEMPLLSYVLVAQGDWAMGEKMLQAGVRPYKFMTPLGFILLEDPNVEVGKLEKFVHAGFDMHVTGWVDLMERRGEEDKITEMQVAVVQLLQQERQSPRSLQRQCRIAIRSVLSRSTEHIHITKKIGSLPLPVGIRSFLNLEFL